VEEDKVYYKIYKSNLLDGKLTVVCMQWFDESDYESERFFRDKDGRVLKFYDENEAINWLLENIKEELIDSEYLQNTIKDEYYYK
jgi:hypothetical protein